MIVCLVFLLFFLADYIHNLPPIDAALKFCRKSIALYETKEALQLLDILQNSTDFGPSTSTAPQAAPESSPDSRKATADPSSSKVDAERVAIVRKIRACRPTQYYEIMGLEKTCTEADVKRAYRKVHKPLNYALQNL
jgi:DnaJ homolog subfamily B member 12